MDNSKSSIGYVVHHKFEKYEIELDHVQITFVNLSSNLLQLAKHALFGSHKLYMEYHDNKNIHYLEINQVLIEKESQMLPGMLQDAKLMS